jgi:NADH:ubiquinone oxidoreductase subunit 5 (subunit L)/multisubunit Na+/H+ antiporter MnhA subunit
MNWIVENLWLIPALPLLAAGITALAKRPRRKFAATLAIGSMALAFGLSCAAFIETLASGTGPEVSRQVYNFNWLQFGDSWLKLGWVLDPLTAVMLVMVTFVGALIFIYSVGYMEHDDNFTRFFCFLSLFAAAMLGLVIANSLLLVFICWELVGLSSYLLIGFWYHKPSAAAAAKKAFLVTRIGDMGLFLGILWLYAQTGTLLLYDDGHGCLEQSALTRLVTQATSAGIAASTAISLLIFCGAIGKSGQVPLHVWLPDAMEGPTPVSALIHAATMVAAGVFLVARVYPLMAATPGIAAVAAVQLDQSRALVLGTENADRVSVRPHPGPLPRERENSAPPLEHARRFEHAADLQIANAALTAQIHSWDESRVQGRPSAGHHPVSTTLKVVVWIGAITAMFAALIAVAQSDIKRILAYSTISQLGYMMMGLGAGGVAIGMFHLITHAFFKSLLFMGAGSVIHGCQGEQDIRRMGGLGKFMPVTFATYAIGMMALSGVPVLFSGFWSKDEILHAAWLWQPSGWPFALGILGAFLTAFYMTRQVCYVFFGGYRGGVSRQSAATPDKQHGHGEQPHESPGVMTMPLVILAACSVLLGFIGTPVWPWFQNFLGAPHEEVAWGGVLALMLASTTLVFAGMGIAWLIYGFLGPDPSGEKDMLETLLPSLFAVLRDKFYIDEIYEATVVRFNSGFARFCHWLDSVVLETLVLAISYFVLGLSWLNRVVDEYLVNLGFDEACGRVRLGGWMISRLQDGQVQNYLRGLGLALTVSLLLLTWGCEK